MLTTSTQTPSHRILGLDPGLRRTGWGLVRAQAKSMEFVSAGVIEPKTSLALADRLAYIHHQLTAVLEQFTPHIVAIEKVFVNNNPASTLLLGMARGVAMVVPAEKGLPVFEYSANLIKKRVSGAGHASKEQVSTVMGFFLQSMPEGLPSDATDALAVAVCHVYTMR